MSLRYFKVGLCLFVFLLGKTALGQDAKKILNAQRAFGNITIDGQLTDSVWNTLDVATSFTQTSPNPGSPSAQRTAIRMLYDNDFVYVGALLYDLHADSILKQLTARDEYEYANTDAFTVVFDTYNDHQNGFAFAVTAAGVQGDAKVRFDNYDYSWNAAWFSKITQHDSGWTVEMKIPYAALRFPATQTQLWGINFLRTIRRSREKSAWNSIKPEVNNALGQAGILMGVKDIVSPLRLALLPYVSAYAENYAGANAQTVNGGLDVKYGLNESFTLDMTLVPDFGQTLYDNRVLNLSPIEVRYDERRYFFTEGVDLFNKNDLFYSRRVGGFPVNAFQINQQLNDNEVIEKNPITTRLYNATKISGRNKYNLGIGFFNAIGAPTFATIRDTLTNTQRKFQTSPLTNYNVVVLDQALKNNSFISFVNTNVTRKENSYNANVSALLVRFANKANSYAIDASTDVSNLVRDGKAVTGYRYLLQAGKIKGNYTWAVNANTISDQFNPNDLGYLARNNVSYYNFSQNYNIYKPFSIFNNFFNNLTFSYNRLYHPNDFQSMAISGSHDVTLRSFHSMGVYWDVNPITANDYFEPRTPGRLFLLPSSYFGGAYLSSDYRKKFALDININKRVFAAAGRQNIYFNVSPRYRFSDRLLVVCSSQFYTNYKEVGFVNRVNNDIYLGTRNLFTIENGITANYIFNSKMALKMNGRHYWSKAIYSKYSLLGDDGMLVTSTYNTNHNINFNTFNVFMNFVWQYRPGSEMNIVYQNSIYTLGDKIFDNYSEDLRYTLQAPQSNSISVKVIYFLDYNALKKGVF